MGRLRILAILAKAMDCLAARVVSMFLISCMVPTWWSISSRAVFSAVKRCCFMVILLVGVSAVGRDGR
ncbi:hypothetical protein D3C87_1866470 [compost metagenome]